MTIMEQSVIRFTRQLPMPIEGGKSTGYDYTRLQNPTREHLEKTVVSLENGIDAVALSTGKWMGTTGKVVGQDSGRSLCTGNGSQSLYAAG